MGLLATVEVVTALLVAVAVAVFLVAEVLLLRWLVRELLPSLQAMLGKPAAVFPDYEPPGVTRQDDNSAYVRERRAQLGPRVEEDEWP